MCSFPMCTKPHICCENLVSTRTICGVFLGSSNRPLMPPFSFWAFFQKSSASLKMLPTSFQLTSLRQSIVRNLCRAAHLQKQSETEHTAQNKWMSWLCLNLDVWSNGPFQASSKASITDRWSRRLKTVQTWQDQIEFKVIQLRRSRVGHLISSRLRCS